MQRYDFFIGDKYDPARHGLMTKSDKGRFVLHTDAQAEIETLLKKLDRANDAWIRAKEEIARLNKYTRKLLDENIDLSNEAAGLRKEIGGLKAWKESALSVTPPLQEIAKEIGVPLGESISGKILPYIRKMKAEVEKRDIEIEELRHIGRMDKAQLTRLTALLNDDERAEKVAYDEPDYGRITAITEYRAMLKKEIELKEAT